MSVISFVIAHDWPYHVYPEIPLNMYFTDKKRSGKNESSPRLSKEKVTSGNASQTFIGDAYTISVIYKEHFKFVLDNSETAIMVQVCINL